MSKAILVNEETGETWTLESFHDCVKGFYLAPSAKKPRLTRVPLNLCEEGDPEKQLPVWMETLKDRGFSVKEEDMTPAEPELTIRWTIEGLVEVDWLPEDLRKIADVQSGIIHIPGKSVAPITMFEKSSFGDGSRRPMLAGSINFLDDLVVLLRLVRVLKEHAVDVCGVIDEESQTGEIGVLTSTPDGGADRAAEMWPEIRHQLEDLGLIKIPVKQLESKVSRSWFF